MSTSIANIRIFDGPDGRIDVAYQVGDGVMPATVRLAIDLSERRGNYLAAYLRPGEAVRVANAMLKAAKKLGAGR